MAHRLELKAQFLAFGAIGIVGFFVDAGVLTLLLRKTAFGFYYGRAVSFLCAATITWALNKSFTFRGSQTTHALPAQWLRFLAANAVGGLVNFLIYSWLVASFVFLAGNPVLAVAAGSLSGLAVNFTLSRTFVFASGAS